MDKRLFPLSIGTSVRYSEHWVRSLQVPPWFVSIFSLWRVGRWWRGCALRCVAARRLPPTTCSALIQFGLPHGSHEHKRLEVQHHPTLELLGTLSLPVADNSIYGVFSTSNRRHCLKPAYLKLEYWEGPNTEESWGARGDELVAMSLQLRLDYFPVVFSSSAQNPERSDAYSQHYCDNYEWPGVSHVFCRTPRSSSRGTSVKFRSKRGLQFAKQIPAKTDHQNPPQVGTSVYRIVIRRCRHLPWATCGLYYSA